MATEGISEPLPASPNIRIPEESTQTKEERATYRSQPALLPREPAQGRVPRRPRDDGTDRDDALEATRCRPVPLTNIAGARFVSRYDVRIVESGAEQVP